jgi:hypothetical protein
MKVTMRTKTVIAGLLIGCASSSKPASNEPTTVQAAPAPRIERPEFVVEIRTPASVAAGSSALAQVELMALGDFHVSPDYPMQFRGAETSSNVTWQQPVVERASFETAPCANGEAACRAIATVPFRVGQAGPAHAAGTLAFSVCSADRCVIEKVDLEKTVQTQ